MKKNVVYERFVFFDRQQKEGESTEEFITALHTLAEYCKFDTLSLIRDRIVSGILDKELSEKMQLRGDLKLEDAITMAKQ